MDVQLCAAADVSTVATCNRFIAIAGEFEAALCRQTFLPPAEFSRIESRYSASLDAIAALAPETMEEAIALGLVAKHIEHGFPDGGLPGDLALRAMDAVIRLHGGSTRRVG